MGNEERRLGRPKDRVKKKEEKPILRRGDLLLKGSHGDQRDNESSMEGKKSGFAIPQTSQKKGRRKRMWKEGRGGTVSIFAKIYQDGEGDERGTGKESVR